MSHPAGDLRHLFDPCQKKNPGSDKKKIWQQKEKFLQQKEKFWWGCRIPSQNVALQNLNAT